MTLQEIRKWVSEESEKPTPPSQLYTAVCDELALIEMFEKSLHHHTADEQVEMLAKDVTLRELPPVVIKAASEMARTKDPQKVIEFCWSRIDPEIRKMQIQRMKDSIMRAMEKEPRLKKNYDFANNKFYCAADLEIMGRIEDSIIFINNLFERR